MTEEKYDIVKSGIQFKVIIEGKNGGAHFALIKTINDVKKYGIRDQLRLERIFSEGVLDSQESQYFFEKGQYYLLWGPEGDSKLEYHGLSPLRSPKNNPWKQRGAMKEFFSAVKNAPKTNFSFKSSKSKITLNEIKYPNGRLY